MLSLLWGLLLQPRHVINNLVEQQSRERSTQLGFFVVLLLMINGTFLFGLDPTIDKYLGSAKWVAAFLVPPIQFALQRFFFMVAARFGLMMFASRQLPREPEEAFHKFLQVRMMFPYVIFPMVVLNLLASPFNSVIADILTLAGVLYSLFLTSFALQKIFGTKPGVSFFGPLLVQVLIGVVLFVVLLIITLLIVLLTGMPLTNPL